MFILVTLVDNLRILNVVEKYTDLEFVTFLLLNTLYGS
jgi:hypothetical protein